MNEPHTRNSDPTEQDAALARRLARLGDQPVPTESLERRLDAAFASLDEPATINPSGPPPIYRLTRWLQPAAGVAAMLALVVALFFVFSTSPPSASAAVVDLAELHHYVEEGRFALPTASSMAAVNQSIAEQRNGRVLLPEEMQGARVQSCCLRDVQGDLVALAVLDDGGPSVSLVVAQAPEFAHEMGVVIEIDGRRFFGHELNGIPMMMANIEDRWLCVMGDRSYEALAQIAAEARF
jgi:hypothetical protein